MRSYRITLVPAWLYPVQLKSSIHIVWEGINLHFIMKKQNLQSLAFNNQWMQFLLCLLFPRFQNLVMIPQVWKSTTINFLPLDNERAPHLLLGPFQQPTSLINNALAVSKYKLRTSILTKMKMMKTITGLNKIQKEDKEMQRMKVQKQKTK